MRKTHDGHLPVTKQDQQKIKKKRPPKISEITPLETAYPSAQTITKLDLQTLPSQKIEQRSY
jgi:hypothetical protein